MRRRRAGGVFWAGAGLTVGVLAGVRIDSPGGAAGLPAVALAAAGLVGAALLLSPGPRRRGPGPGPASAAGRPGTVLVLFSVCLACGAGLGVRSAERSRAACTAGLARESDVRAEGLLERAGEPPGGGTATVRLSAVRVRSGGRSCRLPALRVRTDDRRLPPAGSRVEARGSWRPYPAAGELRRPEHRGSLRAEEVVAGAADGPGGALPGVPAARWRERAASRLDRRLPPDAAALARALTLADRDGLPEPVTRRFARAGLAHLLAISGLHVGVLASGAVWLLGLWLPAGPRHVAAAGLTGAYVLWIGAPASAVRASLLFGGWALSRLRGSPLRTSDLLGAAAAAVLLADPLTALDAGFQMSFAGFSGVVLGAATGSRWTEGRGLGRRTRALLLTAAAGAGACALTAPLTALHFQRAAPVAVVSGLVGTPLVGLALFSSLAVLALPAWMAAPAEGAATGLLRLLTSAVDAFASVPGGHVTAPPPGAAYWVVALLLLLAWARYVRGGRPARSLTPAAGAALVALAWPSVAGVAADLRGGGATLLCMLDVGQGDASAIRTRPGRWLLLDAGPAPPPGRPGSDEGLSTVVPFLTARGAQEVELLALSHPDLDHVGGAGAVLARLGVRRVATAGTAVPGGPHLEFLRAVREEGARWLPLRPGDRMRLDEVEILVLDAGEQPGAGPGERVDANDAGVSLRLTVDDGFTWVTTGDASMAREMAMLERWPADSLRAHAVSVGHHGSRTSTSPAWLEAVSPEVALISAGAGNWFGHPHPVTLRTLEEAGAETRRTDRHGTVCVRVSPDGGWAVEEQAAS